MKQPFCVNSATDGTWIVRKTSKERIKVKSGYGHRLVAASLSCFKR